MKPGESVLIINEHAVRFGQTGIVVRVHPNATVVELIMPDGEPYTIWKGAVVKVVDGEGPIPVPPRRGPALPPR